MKPTMIVPIAPIPTPYRIDSASSRGLTSMAKRLTCAHVGQRAPTGVGTRQRGQIGVSHRPQRRTVSTLGWRAQRTVSSEVGSVSRISWWVRCAARRLSIRRARSAESSRNAKKDWERGIGLVADFAIRIFRLAAGSRRLLAAAVAEGTLVQAVDRVAQLVPAHHRSASLRGRGSWKGKINLYPGWDSPQEDLKIEQTFEALHETRCQ